jgi:chemotaxis protein CheY-P-specific phosphatase CheC
MTLVKLKQFCKVFDKMTVVVASMSHVGKKPREATIFGFTSAVQIAKWLLHGFSLEAFFFVRGLTGLL